LTTTGGFALPTIAEASAQKFQQFNDSIDTLDRALTDRLSFSLTGGNATATTAQVRQYQVIALSGAAVVGRTLTLPAVKRMLLVTLDSGSSQSVGLVRGASTVTIAPGQAAFLYLDGSASGLAAFGFGTVTGPTAYSLPIGSASTLGGYKVGTNLAVDAVTGVLSVDTTGLATSANLTAAINALVASAPGTLDTLNELAAALGNDANFAATVTTALAGKAPLASPGFTGTPTGPTGTAGAGGTQLATQAYADAAAGSAYTLPAASDTVRGGVKVATGTSGLVLTGDALTVDLALIAELTDLTPYAPKASPAFTGTPTAPTPATADDSTTLATTAHVHAVAAAAAGGVAYTLPAASDTVRGGVTVAASAGVKLVGDALSLDLDDLGATQGAVLYRSGSAWTVLAPGTAGQVLTTGGAAANPAWTSAPYDVTLFVEGLMTNAETVLRLAAPRAFTVPAGAAGSYAKAGTAATGSTTLTLYKGGVAFGTMVFAASGATATVTVASATSFAAGDVLSITGPATADAALADIAISLAGSRN